MAKQKGALLILPRTPKEWAFIQNLLERLGLSSASIAEEELLDLGLSRLMAEVDRTRMVDPAQAMKVLRG